MTPNQEIKDRELIALTSNMTTGHKSFHIKHSPQSFCFHFETSKPEPYISQWGEILTQENNLQPSCKIEMWFTSKVHLGALSITFLALGLLLKYLLHKKNALGLGIGEDIFIVILSQYK